MDPLISPLPNKANKRYEIIGVAVTVLVLVALAYFFVVYGLQKSKKVSQSDIQDITKTVDDAAAPTLTVPSANPLEKVLPQENPIEKTNPFNNAYQNPFE